MPWRPRRSPERDVSRPCTDSRSRGSSKDGRPAFEAVPDSAFVMKADLVLLAMGFLGPEKNRLLADLGVTFTDRGTVARDEQWMTSVPGVFAAGDLQRGQSLIVWAIDDGRRAAASVDQYLLGSVGAVPRPFDVSEQSAHRRVGKA